MTRSFIPPKRILMGPGPSDVNPLILEAMARPTIGHLDPQFIRMMEELKELLQYAFQTSNRLTMPVSAPGSAGMETCFANLVEPEDEVIVCQNGVFGGRMKENVIRCGGTPIMVETDWGRAVDIDAVEDALKATPNAKFVAFVHAETSTGAQSDARALTALAHEHDCLAIVDAVTSLGGSPLLVDEWGIDAIYSGSQKCLSCTPGLSPVSFNERALEKVRNRPTPVQSWFLDLNLVMAYWNSEDGSRSYHHTAPVNALYALHEALVLLKQEGLENSWKRHMDNHLMLRAGLETMGIDFIVPEEERLPQLNAIAIPEGIEDVAVRTHLLNEYNLEIGAGLGPLAGKIWRIGQMGYASNPENILFCIDALGNVLNEFGYNTPVEKALEAARAVQAAL